MPKEKYIKWAILGTSFISRTMAKAIQESGSARLVGVGTGTQPESLKRAEQFAQDFNIHKYDSYQAILDDPDIDAIYIGLANHMHKEWIIRCAKAGKHILCDKPMIVHPDDADEIKAVIEANNVFCMEGLMYRCHPFIDQLKQLINDKEKGIGEVKIIHAAYSANFAHLENPVDGGAIRNLGCYPVSLIRLLLNDEPTAITSPISSNNSQRPETTAIAILTFKDDIFAHVSVSNKMEKWFRFDIIGTSGVASVITNPWLPQERNIVSITRGDMPIELHEFKAEPALYRYQFDYVNECIEQNRTSPDEPGITWQHSVGNAHTLETWRTLTHPPQPDCDKESQLEQVKLFSRVSP